MRNPTDPLRSRIMRSVRSENTRPELIVRSTLHRLGYRFRLHRKDLPGKPDIVFPGRHKVIFINGCFWHGHDCPRGSRVPKSNREYWIAKIARNRERDILHFSALETRGWQALAVWECQCANSSGLSQILNGFLGQHFPVGRKKDCDDRVLQSPRRKARRQSSAAGMHQQRRRKT